MRKKIAIAAGGDSGEFEVSVKSGAVVAQYLNREAYDTYIIIFRGSSWMYTAENGREYPVDKNDFSLDIEGKKISFDMVFIAIHGTPGEDGKLQGYLDMLSIPYTTCGQSVSALTFNKFHCLHFMASLGIRTAPSVLLREGDDIDIQSISKYIGIPCFVKPNQGGSSVGMSRVNDIQALQPAIDRAFGEDGEVLVEAFIDGTEITCGVMIISGGIRSFPLTEIVSMNEFFDYEAKYTDGMADEITPARIPADIEKQCRSLSEDLYRKLDCRGFVRFDYIFNDEGMYFLEVNTVPGLSPNSILPQQAESAGIGLDEVFSAAIEEAFRNA